MTPAISPPNIVMMDGDEVTRRIDQFAEMLHECVHGGASIGFIEPFPVTEARTFWCDRVIPALNGGKRSLFAALDGDRVVGTVQLDTETMPNQQHRAEISKLMVRPDCRRRGIARLLMVQAERSAHELGRSLITLDTRTGDGAEVLYLSLGFKVAGIIPDYARDPFSDHLSATMVMFKIL